MFTMNLYAHLMIQIVHKDCNSYIVSVNIISVYKNSTNLIKYRIEYDKVIECSMITGRSVSSRFKNHLDCSLFYS